MSCGNATPELFENLKNSVEILESPYLQDENRISLPRGGVYIQTEHFPIQFGIPPETIKDHFSLQLKVPQIYILPSQKCLFN